MPNVCEESQNRRVGAIVKVVKAPKHCTCAVDAIAKVESSVAWAQLFCGAVRRTMGRAERLQSLKQFVQS